MTVGLLSLMKLSGHRSPQQDGQYISSIIVFSCAVVDNVIFSFFSAFDLQTNLFALLFQHALLPSLYTAALSILFIFSPYRKRKL